MGFQYENRVQEALRRVVREVLEEVAHTGLPDPHHFYISLRTNYPGVQFPETVKKTNPKEITIVLQHQFWDLKVTEEGFSVVLTFQDIPQTVYVPFNALLSFMDPGVRFGLHFTPPPASEAKPDPAHIKPTEMPKPGGPSEGADSSNVISLDQFRRK
jgi:hypothetical protein